MDVIRDRFLQSFPVGLVDKYNDLMGIGNGSTGYVASALSPESGNRIALKLVRNLHMSNLTALRTLREVKYLTQLNHPNIVKVWNIVGVTDALVKDLCIEMDLMEADLSYCIDHPMIYFPEEEQKRDFMFQLLQGLAFLHSAGIVHRDIKPENILFKDHPRIVKIADFDHARKIDGEALYDMTTVVGTFEYLAPELTMQPGRHTFAVDVYSAGVVFLEVLLGYLDVFEKTGMARIQEILRLTGTPNDEDLSDIHNPEDKELMRMLANGRPKRTWKQAIDELPAQAAGVLDKLLHFSQTRRITAENALLLDYFAPYRYPGWTVNRYMGPQLADIPPTVDLPTILCELRNSITVVL